jgi:membrane-associated phospholipid phosphatase
MRTALPRSAVLALFVLASAFPAHAAADHFTGQFKSPLFVVAPDEAPHTLGETSASHTVSSGSIAEAGWQGTPEQHPTPKHTGFVALFTDTGSDFKAFPMRKSTWVILGIGAGAALLAHPVDDNINEKLTGSDGADNFFAAGQVIGSFPFLVGVSSGLYVVGRYIMPHEEGGAKTNKVSHLGFDLLRSVVLSQAFTMGIKYSVQRDRPNGECCAFPSGHSAAAFAVASVLERHLGYRGAWPTFVIAGYVAASRLNENVHFLSDVLFGSALGIASGWTVVGRHGRSEYVMLPTPTRGGMAVTITRMPSRSAAQ